MNRKEPTIDTGMARIGMIAARQVCRNTTTTATTSAAASKKVRTTRSTDFWMNSVGL